MVVLGLLLLLAAIAAGALAVYGLPSADAAKITWHFLGNTLSISPTMIFFIGVASAVALALGLWLMSLGARRSARKRRELKELRRDQREQDRVRQQTTHDRTDRRDDTLTDTRTVRRDDTLRDGRTDTRDGATSYDDRTR